MTPRKTTLKSKCRDMSEKNQHPHTVLPQMVTLALKNSPSIPRFSHITWEENTCLQVKMPFPSPVNLIMNKHLVAQNQELQSNAQGHFHLSRPGCSTLLDAAPFFWASVPHFLLFHLYPLKLLFLRVFLGLLCLGTPKLLCPKWVNAIGSSQVKSSMQSWAGSSSPPALGEYIPLDRYFQFLCLQLFSAHLSGERQLYFSKFGCIYNVSSRHSLS